MNRTEEILFNLYDRKEFYPDDEVRSLVPLGLVEIKKSRYAEYAILTLDGYRTAAKVVQREAGRASPIQTDRAGSDDSTSRRSGRRQPAKPERQAEPSSHAASRVARPATPLKVATERPPKQRASPPTPAVTPNACRVTMGTKVTYYPVASFKGLSGDKALVATINKFYRSYPVAASAADVVVP